MRANLCDYFAIFFIWLFFCFYSPFVDNYQEIQKILNPSNYVEVRKAFLKIVFALCFEFFNHDNSACKVSLTGCIPTFFQYSLYFFAIFSIFFPVVPEILDKTAAI